MKKNLLKDLRDKNTQAEMAEKFGVSQQGWQSWEIGRTVPDNATMLQMENYFNVPMEVIFFDSFNYFMKDLVFLQHRQALTTSLKVAEYFGKRHNNVLAVIERCKSDLLNFEHVKNAESYLPKNGDVENAIIADTYDDAKGEKRPMYLLNRDGFMFVVMGFTGEKAAQLKWNYIQAFNAMEQKLTELNSEQWREVRSATKVGYKELSAAVKELYEWAVAHGCKASEKVFYMNFAKLMNKTLRIKADCRDTLATWQQLQFIARTIIAGLLAKGEENYHLPYRDCKSAFENYARLSFINQRLLK